MLLTGLPDYVLNIGSGFGLLRETVLWQVQMLSCSALKPTWQAYQNQGDGCWPRSVGSPAAVLGASAGTCYRNNFFTMVTK
jgi:hypothetical protein